MPLIENENIHKPEIAKSTVPSRKDRQNDAILKEKMVGMDSKCCYCGQSLVDDQGKAKAGVTTSNDGLCHNICRLSFKHPKDLQVCVILNSWSIGDSITMTPLLREIRRIYPLCAIDVITLIPELFKYNKYIRRIIRYDKRLTKTMLSNYDHIMEPFQPTNPNFLHHWSSHSVDFMMHGGLRKQIPQEDWWYEVGYTHLEVDYMKKICLEAGLDVDKEQFIIIHPHKAEWQTRSWAKEDWAELILKIKSKHPQHRIVSVGGSRDEYADHTMKNYMGQEGVVDLYNKLTVLETLALMDCKNTKMVITVDTAPLHVAACTKELPILGIFTVVRSKFRAPVRNGKLGYKFRGIDISPCSCTYDLRYFSETIGFTECPKQKLLKDSLNSLNNVDGAVKLSIVNILNSLANYSLSLGSTPQWSNDPKELSLQISSELKKYSERIPCHPTASQVFKCFEEFLAETTTSE